MASDRKPLGRLTVRRTVDGESTEMTIGTFWPFGEDGDMSLSLGQTAFKDRPELTVKQALSLLLKGSEKGSGYFTNCRMNAAREARQGRKEAEAAPPAEDYADTDIPF